MNKTQIAKAVVNNLVSLGVSSATGSIVKNNVSRHPNPIVNTVIGISIGVTSYALSGTIMEPVRNYTDREIDKIAEAIEQFKKS